MIFKKKGYTVCGAHIPGENFAFHLPLVLRLKICGAIPPFPIYALIAWTETTLSYAGSRVAEQPNGRCKIVCRGTLFGNHCLE
jgi:hypothetical protein